MHRRARGGIAYFALASAMVVPCVVVISALAPPVFGADGIGIASTVIVGGCGMYLILINLAGFWAGTLGQALPWLGFATGALLLTAAVFGIHAWAAVFPAIALYILWSAWLGVHLWNWAPAEAGAVPS